MLAEVHETHAPSTGGSQFDLEKANFTEDYPRCHEAQPVSQCMFVLALTTYDSTCRVATLSCKVAWMITHLMEFFSKG